MYSSQGKFRYITCKYEAEMHDKLLHLIYLVEYLFDNVLTVVISKEYKQHGYFLKCITLVFKYSIGMKRMSDDSNNQKNHCNQVKNKMVERLRC